MLIRISSDKFRAGAIEFGPGLNVILGDENATNSIGKSSLLMVIDFALGGGAFLEHNRDTISELGHHSYRFDFLFDGQTHSFRRTTDQANFVFPCLPGSDDSAGNPISLERYFAFLKQGFGINSRDQSFRALVGLYLRVWGKPNTDDVHRPLHAAPSQKAGDCVDNLIKTYGMYSELRELSELVEVREAERKALKAAFKHRHLPQISKRERDKNAERLADIREEIGDIKNSLAKYAANIGQVVNREVRELKEEKDVLLDEQFHLGSRLARVEKNIAENRHIKSAHFESILEYFPKINQERLARVEEFHNGLAKILKSELQESRKNLESRLSEVTDRLGEIDFEMSRILSNVEEPGLIVDRVFSLAADWESVGGVNRAFDRMSEIDAAIGVLQETLTEQKSVVLAAIQDTINQKLRELVSEYFGEGRKSPSISLSESGYTFDVFEDTGTGVAYAAILLFDLAVFLTTDLPVLGHDSVLFKNVENDSAGKLFAAYCSTQKQSFVAIDEIQKYGEAVAVELKARAVIRLSDEAVLYVKDWRKKGVVDG